MEPLRTARGHQLAGQEALQGPIHHCACASPSAGSNPAFTLHPKALCLVGRVLLSEAEGSPHHDPITLSLSV